MSEKPSNLTLDAPPRNRRVLMVTGIFPPHAAVGVIRSLKFCRYLPDFGWDAQVLAYRPRRGMEELDERLLGEIPDCVTVHRTRWIDPLALPTLARRFFRRKPSAAASAVTPAPSEDAADKKTGGVRGSKWYRLLRNLPDNVAPWLPFAVARGLLAARDCDCIYSSAPPYTAHMAAYFISRLSGKPLVADFRDPWVGNTALDIVSPRHARFHERWERRVVKRARFVINVTDTLRDRMAHRYTAQPTDKFMTICNGIDECDLPDAAQALDTTDPRAPLTFAYFGTLYGTRSPEPLFRAIRQLLHGGTIGRDDIRVEIYGTCRIDAAALIARFELGGMVDLCGAKPRHWVMTQMGRTGVLLQIGSIEMDAYSLSTKIFEYLAVRRPILALVPEGPIASLVRRENAGSVASPDRIDQIADAVSAFVMEHRAGGIRRNAPSDLTRFTRRHQTGQLAKLLDAAFDNAPVQ